MATQELIDYVNHQLSLGASHETIKQALKNSGWSDDIITQVFQQTTGHTPPAPLTPVPMAVIQPSSSLPSIGTLFSESWQLFKARSGTVIFSWLLLFVPFLLGTGILFVLAWFLSKQISPAVGGIVMVLLGIAAICGYIFATLWASTAQITALRDAEEKTGIKENLKRARPLIGSLFLVQLILVLATIGGMVLLIIPGIIIANYYGFALFCLVTEGKKGRTALAQSKAYVKGRWWKIFGRMLLIGIMYFALYLVLVLISSVSKNSVTTIVVTILQLVLQFVYTLFSLSYSYTLYKQAKQTASQPSHEPYMGGVTGWTVWGSIGGVLVILGLLSSIVLLALNSARAKSRDASRLATVRMISSALELYYNDAEVYPESLPQLVQEQYLQAIPIAPTPADGTCTAKENSYQYTPASDKQDYELTFCLGGLTSGYPAGTHTASYEQGIR